MISAQGFLHIVVSLRFPFLDAVFMRRFRAGSSLSEFKDRDLFVPREDEDVLRDLLLDGSDMVAREVVVVAFWVDVSGSEAALDNRRDRLRAATIVVVSSSGPL